MSLGEPLSCRYSFFGELILIERETSEMGSSRGEADGPEATVTLRRLLLGKASCDNEMTRPENRRKGNAHSLVNVGFV